MRINSVVLSFKNKIVFKDKNIIISFMSIFFGLIFGVIIYIISYESDLSELFELMTGFRTDFADKNPLEIFSGFALSGLPYYIAMFVVGGSIFGKGLGVIMTTLKAMGLSVITSFLYCNMGLRGLEYALLIFFPGKTVFIFSLLLTTVTTMEMSDSITECNKSDLTRNIKSYIIKFVIILLLLLLSWTIDCICYSVFSDLF